MHLVTNAVADFANIKSFKIIRRAMICFLVIRVFIDILLCIC